jgi:hypothetical protein
MRKLASLEPSSLDRIRTTIFEINAMLDAPEEEFRAWVEVHGPNP